MGRRSRDRTSVGRERRCWGWANSGAGRVPGCTRDRARGRGAGTLCGFGGLSGFLQRGFAAGLGPAGRTRVWHSRRRTATRVCMSECPALPLSASPNLRTSHHAAALPLPLLPLQACWRTWCTRWCSWWASACCCGSACRWVGGSAASWVQWAAAWWRRWVKHGRLGLGGRGAGVFMQRPGRWLGHKGFYTSAGLRGR